MICMRFRSSPARDRFDAQPTRGPLVRSPWRRCAGDCHTKF
jgi:hypothetical protein